MRPGTARLRPAIPRCRRTGRRSSRSARRRRSPWRCRPSSECRRRRSAARRCPSAPAATFATAVICGTPTPATTRVVQIEPGPMPTLTPSAPASTSAARRFGGDDVAADDLQIRTVLLDPLHHLEHAAANGRARYRRRSRRRRLRAARRRASSVSAPVPTAAPTRSAPRSSLQARGNSVAFWKSLTVIMPLSSKSSSTTSTFSMRCLCSSASTSSFGAFSRTVISRSCGVMTVETGASSFVSKRRSRCVTMPTAFVPIDDRHAGDVLGARQLEHFADGLVGRDRDRIVDHAALELLDPAALRAPGASMLMFLWMMPMPPSCAIVMARRASVTVSMAADRIGRFRRIVRVSCVLEIDVARQDIGVRRDQEHVVESECFLEDTHWGPPAVIDESAPLYAARAHRATAV